MHVVHPTIMFKGTTKQAACVALSSGAKLFLSIISNVLKATTLVSMLGTLGR